MIEARAVLAGVLGAALTAGAAPGQSRLQDSWIAMVEACVSYAEIGRTEVFAGWDVAGPRGGVYNGDRGSENDDVTFIAPPPHGTGAVRLRVGAADWVGARYFGPGEGAVGDRPAHAFCTSAEGGRHRTDDLGTRHEAWVERQLATRRLVPAADHVSLAAGPYLGCGYDGRAYLVEFSLKRPGPAVLRVFYPARVRPAAHPPCTGAVS
jgi:hypothetical protein